MAVSVSAPPADHAEHLSDVPTDTGLLELIKRLQGEGFISMREAAEMYGRKTHKSTPTRHALNGTKTAAGRVVRLEAVRVGGALVTSRAAVLRFFAAQNAPADAPASTPAPTPAQQRRAAASASKKVAAALGAAE